MNRYHLIIRLQKFFPNAEITCGADKEIIIVRTTIITCRVDAKFNIPVYDTKFLHIDTVRLMLLKQKIKEAKDYAY
jgi:hypothetical protein